MRYKPFSFMGARESGSYICATGGTYTTEIAGYKYHIYSNSGTTTFSMSCNPANDTLEVLVVGGGTDGLYNTYGGGGKAGGVVYNQLISVPLGSYDIVVGSAGGNSHFAYGTVYDITAYGGASGYGASYGAFPPTNTTASYPSQGYDGGDVGTNSGGGAGGATQTGSDGGTNEGGNGGDGRHLPGFAILNTIDFGGDFWFGGYPDGWYGGGGSGLGLGAYGKGGKGGGGYTGVEVVGLIDVMDAIPNTGGGGAGGGGPFANRVGRGSKGIVIIKYRYGSF